MAPSKGGISGLAVSITAVGGFLVYAGIKDVPLIEGLREIITGKVPAGRPQTRRANFIQGFLRPIGGSGVSGTSVPGSYSLPGTQPHVKLVANEVGGRHGVKTIGGFRASDMDHGRGLALDFDSPDRAQGDRIAADLIANRDRYGTTYVIWQMRIASPTNNWAWRPYTTSIRTGDWRHEKHVHGSFKAVHTYRPPTTGGSGNKAV